MNTPMPLFANPETGLVPFGYPLPHDYNPPEEMPTVGGAPVRSVYRFTFFVVENDGRAKSRVFLSLEEAETSLQDSHFPWAEMVKEAFESYLNHNRRMIGEAIRVCRHNGTPCGRGKEAVVLVRRING